MTVNAILTHRANMNYQGVLEEWEKLDDFEKSTHIMTDSEEWKTVQGAQLQAETRQKLIDKANEEQVAHQPERKEGIATHMLMRFFKDPKNEPGVIATKPKTFYALTEVDLRHAIQRYAQKNGILEMANVSPEQLEKYNESNSQV